jgi:hypothetical protein
MLLAKTKEIKVIRAGKKAIDDLTINPLASPVLQSIKSSEEIKLSLEESRSTNFLNNNSSMCLDNSQLNELVIQICNNYDEELEELMNYEKLIYDLKDFKEDNDISLLQKKQNNIQIERHRQTASSDIDDGYKSGNSAISDKTYLFSATGPDNNLVRINSKKVYPTLNSVTIDLLGGGYGKNSKTKIENNNKNNNNNNIVKSKKLR